MRSGTELSQFLRISPTYSRRAKSYSGKVCCFHFKIDKRTLRSTHSHLKEDKCHRLRIRMLLSNVIS